MCTYIEEYETNKNLKYMWNQLSKNKSFQKKCVRGKQSKEVSKEFDMFLINMFPIKLCQQTTITYFAFGYVSGKEKN